MAPSCTHPLRAYAIPGVRHTPPDYSTVRPNPSVNLTHYGRLCKPSLWHMVHHHRLSLQNLPPLAGYLER